MNLDEEVRNGYTISADMKQLWALQLQMTQKIFKVCQEHHLRIWAEGGTLLGTIRHQGFIPWDDDIDLIMPRTDYDKLCALARDEKVFAAPYYFQSAQTEKGYFNGHAQLRMDGTTLIGNNEEIYPNRHYGAFIDIFCYDNVPSQETPGYFWKIIKTTVLKTILTQGTVPLRLETLKHNPKHWLNQCLAHTICLLFGADNLIAKRENYWRPYSAQPTRFVNYPCFSTAAYTRSHRRSAWFAETLYLPFEDIQMPVPIGYKQILALQYGDDYMTPQQIASMHGGFRVMDLHKPYTEYIKDGKLQ